MPYVVAVLVVLVAVLFSQVQSLRARLEALERALRAGSPDAPASTEAVSTQAAPDPLAGRPTPAAPPNRPAQPRVSPWPARQIGSAAQTGSGLPGVSLSAVPGPVASPNPAPPLPALTPREPLNVQRWLTRAGIVATLLGAGYVLAVLEAQGRIGAWWRVLAGLLLGGWLTWLAERAASPVVSQAVAGDSGSRPIQPRWVAEALGSLGISVALLTLTFAAQAGGGSGLWAALLTLLSLASVLLSRRWGGLATPLVSLCALVLALPWAHGRAEAHLWGLGGLGLVCMAWALSALALLPLLVRPQTSQSGWQSALPGAAALFLLTVLSGLDGVGVLEGGQAGEQAGLALLVALLTLAGVLLRPAGVGGRDSAGRAEEALRSVVGTLALGTATGAFCRLTGLDLLWAVPLAALLAVLLLSVLPAPFSAVQADLQIIRRVTLSAALVSALNAGGFALALHSGEVAGRSDWFQTLACLGTVLLAVWRLGGLGLGGLGVGGWHWHGVHVPRLLSVLAACAPLGLLFGVAGVALPLVVWLARPKTGLRSPDAPAPGWTGVFGWASVRTWHAAPLAFWALFALPLLASGVLAGSALARSGETALLLFGAAALLAYSLALVLRPAPGSVPWLLAALLAWSGSWLLAAVLGRVQGTGTEDFVLTTPALALLGGWLLFRAQPARPGDAPWKWGLWMSGAGLLVFALLRVLLSDLSASDPLIRAAGLLGAGLVTVLAGVRFPPPSRS